MNKEDDPDPDPPKPQTTTGFLWKNLFSPIPLHQSSSSSKTFLEDGTPVVTAPSSVLLDASAAWTGHLVCHFLGEPPSPAKLFSDLNPVWGRKGAISVRRFSEGTHLVYVPSASMRKWVLDAGLWSSGNVSFTVTEWCASQSLVMEKLVSAPTVLTISGVPPQLWSQKGIETIAEGVATLIPSARASLPLSSLGTAKIRALVTLGSNLPNSVVVKDSNGATVRVTVDYGRLPILCPKCKNYGHSSFRCPSRRENQPENIPPPSKNHSTSPESSTAPLEEENGATPNTNPNSGATPNTNPNSASGPLEPNSNPKPKTAHLHEDLPLDLSPVNPVKADQGPSLINLGPTLPNPNSVLTHPSLFTPTPSSITSEPPQPLPPTNITNISSTDTSIGNSNLSPPRHNPPPNSHTYFSTPSSLHLPSTSFSNEPASLPSPPSTSPDSTSPQNCNSPGHVKLLEDCEIDAALSQKQVPKPEEVEDTIHTNSNPRDSFTSFYEEVIHSIPKSAIQINSFPKDEPKKMKSNNFKNKKWTFSFDDDGEDIARILNSKEWQNRGKIGTSDKT